MASSASTSAARGRPRWVMTSDAQRRATDSGAAPTPLSDHDLEAIVGRKNLERRAGAGDLLEPLRLPPDPHQVLVIGNRLVVEQAQSLRSGHLAQLDADDVARVAPVLLDRYRVSERVHGVEDH